MRAVLLASATAANFGGLPLEKCGKPGRRLAAAHSMLDHRGSADDEHAAQSLVAGARDHAETDLARSRMILWR